MESKELSTASAEAAAIAEIQSVIAVAKRFPRNEMQAEMDISTLLQHQYMAEKAIWSYPRGGQKISGPSVYLAREIARIWGNIQYGADIVFDSDDIRTVKGWAWDVERNTKVSADATFKKLVQRRVNGVTKWVEPDERDLRELTNKHAAICYRNCLLQLFPAHIVQDVVEKARSVINVTTTRPVSELLKDLEKVGIDLDMVRDALGDGPYQPADLIGLKNARLDGNIEKKSQKNNVIDVPVSSEVKPLACSDCGASVTPAVVKFCESKGNPIRCMICQKK